MTSSSCIKLGERREKRMSKTSYTSDNCYKTLTDFSIESIIGISQDDKHKKEIKLNQSRNTTAHNTECSKSKTTTKTLLKPQETDINNNRNNNTMLAVKKYRPKNFQCPACEMAFSNNGQLKNHVRIHTGERPFRCNYLDCNKTFTRNEELTRHKLIHTGVRPHCCNSCGKRFGRKDHLKKHVRTHERKKSKRKQSSARLKTSFETIKSIKTSTSQTILDNDKFFVPSTNKKSPQSTTTVVNSNSFNNAQTEKMLFSQANIMPVKSKEGGQFEFQQQSITNNSGLHNQQTIYSHTYEITKKYSNPLLATTNAIQQFANDYWNKWYNLIGLCQHQQQHLITAPALINNTQLHPSAQLESYQRKL